MTSLPKLMRDSEKLRFTPRARRSLVEVARYSLKAHGTVQRDRYMRELEASLLRLVDFPEMGRQRLEIREDVRAVRSGQHLIFYRIADEKIEIIGVPHQSMDIIAYFGEEGS